MRQRLGVFPSQTANIQNVIGKKWGGSDSALGFARHNNLANSSTNITFRRRPK